MLLNLLTAYRDRNHIEAATSSKLTTGTGDQDDAIALALASNITATGLHVSKSPSLVTDARRMCVLIFNSIKAHTD
jgi:organic hydroperoxide reductase OsmC/OhrA